MPSTIRRRFQVLIATMFTLAFAATAWAQAGIAALPQVVKDAFTKSYPGATISAASQTTDAGRTLFRVESTDRGRKRTLLYEPNGRVVEVAEPLEEKELPKAVAAAMYSHPRAIFVSALKVTRGTNVEYRLTLRGTRKTAMVAKPDGTVLSFQ